MFCTSLKYYAVATHMCGLHAGTELRMLGAYLQAEKMSVNKALWKNIRAYMYEESWNFKVI